MTFDLQHLQCIACDVMKFFTEFERSRSIRGGVIAISIFDLMTLNMCYMLCSPLAPSWPLTTYRCLNYSVSWCWYVMSRCDLYLWPVDLESCGTSSVMWSKSVRNSGEIEQYLAELLIILRIFAHIMSLCDLDLWSLDLELLQHFSCHAFKLCTKFELNGIIHGWVIYDLARFCRTILAGRALLPSGSQACVHSSSLNLAEA